MAQPAFNAFTHIPYPRNLLTLADLSTPQIARIIGRARSIRNKCRTDMGFHNSLARTLRHRTIAFLFSKRSTRTRIAGETAATYLGAHPIFLSPGDSQVGVNESLRDSAVIIGGMASGIFARVGPHSDLEELVKYSDAGVINALSDLWHPTQILADLMTILDARKETLGDGNGNLTGRGTIMKPLTIAYVGDSTNVLHDMLVTYPRFGHHVRVASPNQPKYRCPDAVWKRVTELGCAEKIWWGDDPREAVKNADVVCTDTWISMGQEAEKAERLEAFKGYQVTEALCREGGAKEDWKFLHCMPRKSEEVDDEVFFGPRSLAYPEAHNRLWTTISIFAEVFRIVQSPIIKSTISEVEAGRDAALEAIA